MKKSAKKIGFLIDMDGVLYRGSEIIPGAIEWVDYLIHNDIPFKFVTNNSQKTERDAVTKLHRMGMTQVQEKHVFTCATATADYLAKQKPNGTAYVIGEAGLTFALHEAGFSIVDSDPDYVVIGEGRTITMEMLEKAVDFICDGAKLIATNLDPTCPVGNGKIRPGCGSYTAMLEMATGEKAFSVGKPNPYIMMAAKSSLKLRNDQVYMIGDTMSTDILGGVQVGFNTMLVLSGGTKRDDLVHYSYKPDMVFSSVAEIHKYVEQNLLLPAPKKQLEVA